MTSAYADIDISLPHVAGTHPAWCWHAGEYYRNGYTENADGQANDAFDDYGNQTFVQALWRSYPFNTHDPVYTAEETALLDPLEGHSEVAIKHLTPAQIAWVDMLVSCCSRLQSAAPCFSPCSSNGLGVLHIRSMCS